jgi:hypothetical protein
MQCPEGALARDSTILDQVPVLLVTAQQLTQPYRETLLTLAPTCIPTLLLRIRWDQHRPDVLGILCNYASRASDLI